MKHLPKAHILACAPSNSGADLLCQRLRVHLPSSIYRLLAPSRDIHLVPEDIKVPGEGQRVLLWVNTRVRKLRDPHSAILTV